MSNAKYLLECYTQEFDATIESVRDGKFITLNHTYFYPTGGGQPFDTGKILTVSGQDFNVVNVSKLDGNIVQEVDKEGLQIGDRIHGIIDWERRYKHMRMHTAAHVLCNVIEKETGALITGNQLGLVQSRVDFSLENFNRDQIKDFEEKTNKIVQEAHPMFWHLMSKEEAEKKVEKLTTLAKGFPEHIKEVRLVEIQDFAIEACGGTHLKNTSEIKGIKITRIENKGAKNRRVYFELEDL